MRRPAPELLWTLVVVLVLATAGVGIAVIGTRPGQDAPAQGTPLPSLTPPPPPGVSPVEPAPTAPSPTRRPSSDPEPTPPTATASACPQLTEQVPLRVMTLNIHFGIGPDGFDISRIARFISSQRVDVVLLQEVDRFLPRSRYLDLPTRLARETGMESAFGLNVRRRGRGEYGVATLSRFPITLQQHTLLPNRPGLEQRGLLRTDLDVGGTTVSIYNTHLQNKVPSMRMEQLAAIRRVVGASEHPVVFGGDLNSGPGSPMMRLARSFASDVWPVAGSGPGQTAPAAAPRYRIDYLMYTDPLVVTGAEVVPTVVSDHRAVRARLLLSVAGDEVCVPELDGPVGASRPGGRGAGRDR